MAQPAPAVDDEEQSRNMRYFEIPTQPLTSAVTSFGDQAAIQVTVDGSILSGLTSTPVSGNLTPVEALNRLLNGDRKSVVQGRSVYVRVDLGGRRIIEKKTKEKKN